MRKKSVKKQAENPAKTPVENSPDAEDLVKLKPILGIRPGRYLAALYGLVIVLVLFFILLLPGLRRPGSLVVFVSEPAGAALRVDGVYMGTAPGKIFVAQGPHTFEAVLPGFNSTRMEADIPGRVFASALFPRRFPLEVTLDCPSPAAAFAAAAADYAAWTFGGEPAAAWQVPLSLSEAAYRLGPALAVKGEKSGAQELLRAASRFAVTRASLRDLVRAKFLADSGGLPPSPAGIVHSAAGIVAFLSENPGSAAWLASLLPPESAALVKASAWYHTAEQGGTKPDTMESAAGGLPARLRLAGLSFTQTGGFMWCDTAASAAAFSNFIAANPRWRSDNRQALVTEGLVSDTYLSGGAFDPQNGADSVSSVSWFAAQAFCEWLETQLPASMEDYEVRLPTEAEWEYAAKTAQDPSWEWCADPYAPLPFIKAPDEAVSAVGSPERLIRGAAEAETRASLPPAFCPPFVSFRPVIARRAR
jgi:hypothetical protein